MENIPDPKYQIGDVVEVKEVIKNYTNWRSEISQMLIKDMFFLENIWIYQDFEHLITEDQIIKKLN